MNRITTTLAAALLLGGLGSASAAPIMPSASTLVDGGAATEVGYRHGHRHRHGYHHRHGLRHHEVRRPRSLRSDPNARNPSQPGYQQQKGQTSGGPRY